MNESSAAGIGVIGILIMLAIAIFMIATVWRVFTKAGQPGWACLIPIYNVYVLIKVAGKPGWWLILMFVPLVNIVVDIIVIFAIATRFGKGIGFGFGLLLLPIIFYPILAFGSATYTPAPPMGAIPQAA